MTLFNYIFEHGNIMFYSLFVEISYLITGSFLSNYIFEGIIIILIIWLASGSKATRMLDVTSKVIGSAAGSTFLYNYWVKGSSSQPSSENNDKNKI